MLNPYTAKYELYEVLKLFMIYVMTYRLCDAKPPSEPTITYWNELKGIDFNDLWIKIISKINSIEDNDFKLLFAKWWLYCLRLSLLMCELEKIDYAEKMPQLKPCNWDKAACHFWKVRIFSNLFSTLKIKFDSNLLKFVPMINIMHDLNQWWHAYIR